MVHDELVEKVARALYKSCNADFPALDAGPWEEQHESVKEQNRRDARAALSVARPVIKEECVDAVFEVGDHASASAYADAIRAME